MDSDVTELARLTGRQRQVVDGVARGLTNKEIAAELGLSERSVKAHVSELLRKFAVPNRAGLIANIVTGARGRPLLHLDASQFEQYETVPFMFAATIGPEHRFVFVNRTAAEVAGRPASSLIGLPMHEAYPDLDQRFADALDQVLRTGVPWSAPRAPARFTHPDGTYRDTWLKVMFAPIRDADGAVVGLLHIGTEVDPDEA